MQFSVVLLAGLASIVSAQTYTGPTPTATGSVAGCTSTYSGTFELSVVNGTTASKLKRAAVSPNALLISLKDSVLTDNEGRIGYIASNYQFQFDFGGQAGEVAGAGFSICGNNTLALGSSAVWYECLSGTFYNLYSKNWAAQCKPVFLDIIPASTSGATSATATATASSDPTSSAVATETSDGQVGGSTVASQTSSASASVVTSVTAVTSSGGVVSSISDHQIQGATSTSAMVSSETVVSTVTPAPSSTTAGASVVSSISDHQIQAPTSVAPYTGAAAMPTVAAQLLLAAAGAAVALF